MSGCNLVKLLKSSVGARITILLLLVGTDEERHIWGEVVAGNTVRLANITQFEVSTFSVYKRI